MAKRLLITLLTEIRIHVIIDGGQEMNWSQRQGFKGSHNNRFGLLELKLGVICGKQDLCVPVTSFLSSVTFHSVAV